MYRLNRTEYIIKSVKYYFLLISTYLIRTQTSKLNFDNAIIINIVVLSNMIFASIFLLATFALINAYIYRLHDFNFSGWWLLILLVLPFYDTISNLIKILFFMFFGVQGLLFFSYNYTRFLLLLLLIPLMPFLFLFFYPGDRGKNKFGAAPTKPSKKRSIFAAVCLIAFIIFITILTSMSGKYL